MLISFVLITNSFEKEPFLIPDTWAHPPGPHPTWPPTKAGLLAGQATMYVASPPCMGSVPHHAFGFPTMYLNQRYQVSSIIINQALRKEMKTSEQTHARAVRKVPINSWEQGPAQTRNA